MRPIMTTRRHVLLHCCAGTSDKTYQMKLMHNASKSTVQVHIEYGKRHGSKIKDINWYDTVTEAEEWFIRQMKSKLKKGYADITPPGSGTKPTIVNTGGGRKKKEITPEMINKAESLLAFADAL